MSDAPAQRQLLLHKIYLKDASVEVPKAPSVYTRPWQPQMDVQVNTGITQVNGDNWQVLLGVTVTAKLGDDVAFLIEVHQAGIFGLPGFPDGEREAVLAGHCAGVVFPYAREAISELVQRAGFPAFLLQPINFDAVYAEHNARLKATQAAPADARPH
ncbi:MAG TPA: protein-export chaperone SecB [Nevskiaceae bacterium]|nr:protein-export chaperone SecB [Nevskiaceae bacterium]